MPKDLFVKKQSAPKRILIIQLRQLGDILLTTPVLREIRRECPTAHIAFFCHRMGAAILTHNPYLDTLYSYHPKDPWHHYLKTLRALRAARFDLVLDFMGDPRSALATWLSNSTHSLAFRSARRLFYRQTIDRHSRSSYIVSEKFRLLVAAGFHPQNQHLDFPWDAGDLGPATALYKHPLIQKNPAALRVVLSPTHRRPIRKWPLARYCELAEVLTQRWQAVVIWIWGPGEEAEIDTAIAQCRVATCKAPATSLRELTALLAQQDLFVGNSNGPSHLAVATDIHSLQLHGHTQAHAWCPMTPRHQAIQSPEFTTHATPSLAAISLASVWDKLNALYPSIQAAAQKAPQGLRRRRWDASS